MVQPTPEPTVEEKRNGRGHCAGRRSSATWETARAPGEVQAWQGAVLVLPFVIGCVHLRCEFFVVAFKVDAAKIETTRRKEHSALRELDLAEWTVRESKDETASAVEVTHDADGKVQLESLELDQNTSRVHNFIMAFFDYSGSADCDDSNGGDDDDEYGETDDDSDSEEGAGETDAEPHSGFEEWLCERKISWLERRIRKGTTAQPLPAPTARMLLLAVVAQPLPAPSARRMILLAVVRVLHTSQLVGQLTSGAVMRRSRQTRRLL